MSFERFQSAIDEVTLDLAGPRIRSAVANQFVMFLGLEVSRGSRFQSEYGASGSNWTKASVEHFAAATDKALRYFRKAGEPVFATAVFENARLVLRGNEAAVVGDDFSMSLAWIIPDRGDSRGGKCQISLNKAGEAYLAGDDTLFMSGSKPTTTHAKSMEAAHKSLRRMVEEFFKIKFTNNAEEAS